MWAREPVGAGTFRQPGPGPAPGPVWLYPDLYAWIPAYAGMTQSSKAEDRPKNCVISRQRLDWPAFRGLFFVVRDGELCFYANALPNPASQY